MKSEPHEAGPRPTRLRCVPIDRRIIFSLNRTETMRIYVQAVGIGRLAQPKPKRNKRRKDEQRALRQAVLPDRLRQTPDGPQVQSCETDKSGTVLEVLLNV